MPDDINDTVRRNIHTVFYTGMGVGHLPVWDYTTPYA